MWIFADKIKSQSKDFQTCSYHYFFLFFKFRLEATISFLLSIDIAKKFIDWSVDIVTDYCWSWTIQNKCDRREDVNAKAKNVREDENKYMRSREWESWMRILNENFEWEFWSRRYLQINMMKRSILKTKQRESDIDFANVCCLKLLEFELFQFLLIDAFWLTADIENMTHWRRTDEQTEVSENDELNWLYDRFLLTFVFLLFMSLFSYRCCDVIDSSSSDVLIAKM